MTYQIRLASIADLDLVYNMAVAFYRETDYDFPVDEAYGKNFLQQHLGLTDRLTLVLQDEESNDIGLLLAVASVHPFSPCRVANELVWWVDPIARGPHSSFALLDFYEYWAVNKMNCRYVALVSSGDPRLDKLYTRRGYNLLEKTFMKEFV